MLRRLLVITLITLCAGYLFAEEVAYENMAKELAEAAGSLNPPKIAIMSFTYVDGRKSDGGEIVSERLTTRMVKLKKFQVIERSLLDKVLQEQQLGTTGVIDAESTKKLGKILGVSAIITGTLLDVEDGMVEINARIINTETAEVLTTSSVEVKKVWSDIPTSGPVPQTQPQPEYQQPSTTYEKQSYYGQPAKTLDSFFDVLIGAGGGSMDLSFENPSGVYQSDIGFSGLSPDPNEKISFTGLKTRSGGLPLGFRVGGYGIDKPIGFDLELSHFSQQLNIQDTTVTTDFGTESFRFLKDDYFNTSTYLMAFDLLLRFATKTVQPYVGIGLGFSLTNVTSQYIYQESSTGNNELDETDFGFLYRFPLGLRIKLSDSASAFAEYRYTGNSFTVTRGISGETDHVTLYPSQIMFGAGFVF